MSNAANDYLLPDNTKINASLDDDNNILPDIYIPINWSKNISSDIEYKLTEELDTSTVDGEWIDSNKDDVLKSEYLNLYLLKYTMQKRKSSYSFGLGYTSESYEKSQVGFAKDEDATYDFNNNMLIEVNGINGYINTTQNFTKKLSVKLDFLFVAGATLNVSQDTEIVGYENGSGKSSENLDLLYELRMDVNYNLFSFLDLGFESRYKFIPMNYSLELAYADDTYVTTDYDVEETKLYNAFKLYFKNRYLEKINVRPMIGYYVETNKSDTTEKNSQGINNDSSSSDVSRFIFGLTSKF